MQIYRPLWERSDCMVRSQHLKPQVMSQAYCHTRIISTMLTNQSRSCIFPDFLLTSNFGIKGIKVNYKRHYCNAAHQGCAPGNPPASMMHPAGLTVEPGSKPSTDSNVIHLFNVQINCWFALGFGVHQMLINVNSRGRYSSELYNTYCSRNI